MCNSVSFTPTLSLTAFSPPTQRILVSEARARGYRPGNDRRRHSFSVKERQCREREENSRLFPTHEHTTPSFSFREKNYDVWHACARSCPHKKEGVK